MRELRILLAADEAIGPRVANLIQRSPHQLVAVATPPKKDERTRRLATVAATLEIPCLDAHQLNGGDLVEEITSTRPDVLLNVHSLTKVSNEVLSCFATGAWNLHPGPLPEGAGANVPSWALALGWDSHGVTLHRMTAEYDDGDISFEDRFPIASNATGLTLSAECSRRGLTLIAALLEQLGADPSGVPSISQDLTRRTYYAKKQPFDGRIDWDAEAARIDGYVRACDFRPFPSPWQPPRAVVGDTCMELISVEIGEETDEPAGSVRLGDPRAVAAADRWITLTEVREVTQ